MTKLWLKSFRIKRYRSLKDVTIQFSKDCPVIICGENNIGKTNILRALNLFFNFDKDIFNPAEDIPYHIYHGSRGASTNVELEAFFSDSDEKHTKIKLRFGIDEVRYFINGEKVNEDDIKKYLGQFKYFFVQSSNINIPELLSSMLENEGLLPLDKKRKKQTESLEALDLFIEKSKIAVESIEDDINDYFAKFTDFDGFLKGKKIKINFAEYERLRDALKNIVSITLQDGNTNGIVSKGSGAQRIVLLSLIQYIANKSDKQVLWGIDEPEAFLQPKLQKKVKCILKDIAKKTSQQIILTSHSPHFIDLNQLDNTYLFTGKLEPKEFARKPGEVFFEMSAIPDDSRNGTEKLIKIKEHLGVDNSDSWVLFPYNVLVEGETDKKYLETLIKKMDYVLPNILPFNGATKVNGYLQYLNLFSDELPFKPEIMVVFDKDEAGKSAYNSLNPSKYKNLTITKLYIESVYEDVENGQIEDFVPQDAVFDAVNLVLRKEKYKKISKVQRQNKNKETYKKHNILKYCEEISRSNNIDKEEIHLCEEGRKRQICQKACELMDEREESYQLSERQTSFLKQLTSCDKDKRKD
ncbi:MAG: AAA family ATPase [Alphaproteobacteria bacterium]|nr:AAA family ATPase [Alphaproteobacteria bacterium]